MTSLSSQRLPTASDRDRSASIDRYALWIVALGAGVATVVHLVIAQTLPVPWVLPDELIYSEMAKSLAEGSLPAVRGEPTRAYGILYPLLIAPAWAIFDDPARAYQAAKVINALVLGLAAFPAFFLAKRFVSQSWATLVAIFSVLIPSMLYSGTLLTEVALYPAFLLALLGIVAALQHPSRRNQLLAVGGIGLACTAKSLAVVLVPVYVLCVIHLGILDRRAGGTIGMRVRAHSTATVVLGAVASAAIFGPALLGDPTAVLGAYGVVLGNIDLSSSLVWLVRHLAALDLYVAVIPFAASAALIVLSVRRACDRRVEEFAAVTLWTVAGVLIAISAYSSKPSAGAVGYLPTEARLHERNMFFLVPLLLIGLALYTEQKRPGSRRLVAVVLAVSVGLPFLLPLTRLLPNANFQALTLIPWGADAFSNLWPLTFVPLAVLAALVFVMRSPRSSSMQWILVAIVFVVTTLAAQASMAGGSERASTGGVGADTRWIDHAVPPGEAVLSLWIAPSGDVELGKLHPTVWMSEFFNRSVGEVVEVGRPMPFALPHIDGEIRDSLLRSPAGTSIAAPYVFAPCWVVLDGTLIGGDRLVRARLYRVDSGQIRVLDSWRPDPSCGRRRVGTGS